MINIYEFLTFFSLFYYFINLFFRSSIYGRFFVLIFCITLFISYFLLFVLFLFLTTIIFTWIHLGFSSTLSFLLILSFISKLIFRKHYFFRLLWCYSTCIICLRSRVLSTYIFTFFCITWDICNTVLISVHREIKI